MKVCYWCLWLPVLLTGCVTLDYYPEPHAAWWQPPPIYGYGNVPPRQSSSGVSMRSSGTKRASSTAARSRPVPVPASRFESSSPVPPFDGDVFESYSGNRTYRDKTSGQIIGSEWTSSAGTTTYRDASGSIVGSSWESPAGTTTYRDGNGSITSTSSSNEDGGGGKTTTYRRNGVIVGTKYVSPVGNTTWRDGSGIIIQGPGEMRPQ